MMRTVITLTLYMLMAATIAAAAPQIKVEKVVPATVQSTVPPLPEGLVMLEGIPLLAIKAKVLSFSPEDRAKTISTRLAKLVKDPFFLIDSIKVVDGESTSDIVTGDLIIMSVSALDAQAEGKPRLALAEEFAVRIRSAVDAHTGIVSVGII